MLFHLPFGLADSPPFDKKHYKQVSSKERTKFYEGLPLLRCIRRLLNASDGAIRLYASWNLKSHAQSFIRRHQKLKCKSFTFYYWQPCRATLVVASSFLPQKFGRWWRPTNGALSFYECRLSGGNTQRSWGHSNPTCCNQICLNFLHSWVVGC